MTLCNANQRAVQQLNEKLVEAKEKAEQSNVSKSQFLATMSHELRTPLHGVLACCNLLMDTVLNREQVNYLRIMFNSSNILLKLITNILDFSKIEAGKLLLEKTAFDLGSIMHDIVDCLQIRAKQKHVDLSTQVQDVPKYIIGDPTRLTQVVINLLENALKFTPEGGKVSLKIKIDEKNSKMIEFKVIDTGIGISADSLHLLFQRFTQVDSSTTRLFGGTGLGLTISKSIVECMQGHIQVNSEQGVGSTFIFSIPFEIPDSEQVARVIKQDFTSLINVPEEDVTKDIIPYTEETESVDDSRRILIAEDNLINRNVMAKMLTKVGYSNFEMAYDGEQAFEKFKSGNYSVVLMDISMPKIDGLGATRLIRNYEQEHLLRPIPIVAVTANATSTQSAECMKAGMTHFLTKPTVMKTLKEMLDSIFTKEGRLDTE
jgi:CheY-like chemotaxis protein/nitrogen-specific signal transduction histidine kinase